MFFKFSELYSSPVSSVWYECSMVQTCSHTPSTVWQGSCKALSSDAIFLFCLSSQQRKGGPTRLTLPSKSTVRLYWFFTAAHKRVLTCAYLDNVSALKILALIFLMLSGFFLQHCLGCGSGPPVEFRFFWELGKPEPGLHQRHQCLCWAAHQAAFTQTAQPLVHTGEHTAKITINTHTHTHTSNQ